MSYELDCRKQQPCPCGKGTIVTESCSNDWNQQRSSTILCCDECRKDYHIESAYNYRHGMCNSFSVLVPNTMTLKSFLPSINVYSTPIVEQFCYTFSFSDLELMNSELCVATACSKLKNEKARKAVKMCRESCKCDKLSFVREKIQEAISLYHTLEPNYDSDKSRLAEVQKHLIVL